MTTEKLPKTVDDLEGVDYRELVRHYRFIGRVIKSRRLAEIENVKRLMNSLDLPDDLVETDEAQTPRNGARKPATPKYRNPENPDETWSGRGKAPAWMQAHIDAGDDKSELLIQ